jgi:hypothetical protein
VRRKVADSSHDEVIDFQFSVYFIIPVIMVIGLTEPPTEKTSKNVPASIALSVRKVDTLTAICEPIV